MSNAEAPAAPPQADPAVVMATLEALANRYKAERDRIEQELVSMTIAAQAASARAAELTIRLQVQEDLVRQLQTSSEGAN